MALTGWALKGWALKGWAPAALTAVALSLPDAHAQGESQSKEVAAADAAQRAYAAGDYQTARRLWGPPAQAGLPQARFGLAMLYDLGQGVMRDPAKAYHLYLDAAQAGFLEAEFDVAVMRDSGDGVPRDTSVAALWYARAAAHGNQRAQYNLGLLYAAGDGVPRNPEEAEAYFRAAASSLSAAANKLAAMQRDGRARLPVSARQTTALAAARPVSPADGSAVPALSPPLGNPPEKTSGDSVELVWVAPAQPTAVRFFVQVMALDPAGPPREVFVATLDETSVLVPLEQVPGRYAWRVYSVGRDLKHYAASAWERFEAGAPR